MSTSGKGVFTNIPIDNEALPLVQALSLLPVSSKYRLMNLVLTAAMTVIILGLLTVIRFQPFFFIKAPLFQAYPWFCLAVLMLGCIVFTYHWFADKVIGYGLREVDMTLRKGLFFRNTTTQPILRIQHIELKQGPIERAAGLSRLQVFSAGGAGHTFEIPGLETGIAQQLRQYILEHKDTGIS